MSTLLCKNLRERLVLFAVAVAMVLSCSDDINRDSKPMSADIDVKAMDEEEQHSKRMLQTVKVDDELRKAMVGYLREISNRKFGLDYAFFIEHNEERYAICPADENSMFPKITWLVAKATEGVWSVQADFGPESYSNSRPPVFVRTEAGLIVETLDDEGNVLVLLQR